MHCLKISRPLHCTYIDAGTVMIADPSIVICLRQWQRRVCTVYACLQQHDYASFFAGQLKERKTFRYPPFYRLIVLTLKHRDFTRLDTAARELSERLHKIFGARCSDVVVPSVSRVQNMHLRTLRLRIETSASFAQAKQLLMQQVAYVQTLPNCKGTIIQPDVDPMG